MLVGIGSALAFGSASGRKRIAAIVTEYRPRSHADVICSRIFDGYTPNGVRVEPRTRIVSMYTDQIPPKDMSRDMAARHGFSIYPTVAETLSVPFDAVLLIGEHGDYPLNEWGQKIYPRYELFQQIVEVFRKSGHVVPVFSDKHLSWSWERARQMYDEARELKIPFMAGSSIPVTMRVPELELPLGARIEHAVAIGYGDLEAYGFHTLEALQCMVERRARGETGVAAVQALSGDDVWNWSQSPGGQWTKALLEAALACNRGTKPGPARQSAKNPALFLIEYRDGLRAAIYMLDGYVASWLFAAKLKDRPQPVATQFGMLPETRDLPHFDGLVHCIEELFVTRRPVYPVERTLLTTGILSFLMESRYRNRRIETPQLKVAYRAPKHAWFERA
jgi:hypothetical protein